MKTLSYISAGLLLLVFFISGCQDIFTYGPLDFLQRDPSTLSKDQQLLYAQQALSSGKRSAMEDALDVVVNDLLPDDPTNPELYILAADLMWTLSDTPIALQNYLFENSQQFPDPATPALFPTFVGDLESRLTPEDILLLQIAASFYWMANTTLAASLNGVQQLAAGVGILSYQLSLPLGSQDPAMITAAETYITDSINILVPVP
jgi:hypothetical protein